MKIIPMLCLLLVASQAMAVEKAVFQQSVHKPVAEVYDEVREALENASFAIVFEANIGKNLANFADRWGADYNKNKLTAIRSMVFCNGRYANQVSNLDPSMLGFCPLHLTLIEKSGETTVLFNLPTAAIKKSPALPVLREAEASVIKAIGLALRP